MSVLEARSLTVAYGRRGALASAVAELSLALAPGRIVGLAGESGAGKSTLALALAGYRLPGATISGGEVACAGVDLTRADRETLRGLWGAQVAYLPQDCSTALNPALRLGGQLAEVVRAHLGLGRNAARARSLELLARVGIGDPPAVLRRYPHELSGGEQQRVALALAISCDPRVLILDEPTTGLDGRTEARVTALVAALARSLETATLLVSHDLALLASVCDELCVMYAGRIVERGPAAAVFADPGHPYTAALIAAIPTISGKRAPHGLGGSAPPAAVSDRCGFAERCCLLVPDCLAPIELRATGRGREVRCIRPLGSGPETETATDTDTGTGAATATATATATDNGIAALASPGRAPGCAVDEAAPASDRPVALLEVRELRCRYGQDRAERPALDGVSFTLGAGGSLGVLGESGAGKSTLLHAIAGLKRPELGAVSLAGAVLDPSLRGRDLVQVRAIQLIFQNPDSTLNPRHTVGSVLERPLKLFRSDLPAEGRRAAAADLLARVELASSLLERFPHELSAGQRQRVAIARALIPGPSLLLCDEPTSALDVSAQAAVLELLGDLRRREGLAVVFVSHDLGVLRHVADELVVIEQGVVRERGPVVEVLRQPRDRYTAELIAAIPDPRAPRP